MITQINKRFKTKVIDNVPEYLCLLTSVSIQIQNTWNEDLPIEKPVYEIYGEIKWDGEYEEEVCTPRHITIHDRACAIQIMNYTHNAKKLMETLVTVNYPNPIDKITRNILEKGDSNV